MQRIYGQVQDINGSLPFLECMDFGFYRVNIKISTFKMSALFDFVLTSNYRS